VGVGLVSKPVFIPAERAKLVQVFGGDIYLTMPLAETGRGVSLFEDVRRPGDGPPLHVHHKEDEIFRIVEGRFRLRIGDATFDAGPGDTLLLPRDVPHSFINSGDVTGRLLIVLQPGGFERFFLEVAEQGLAPPADMRQIAELAARYGLEFLGPNPFGVG
jgi:mannose-6-phosphate isomerase-like protein (cupin superfamily)